MRDRCRRVPGLSRSVFATPPAGSEAADRALPTSKGAPRCSVTSLLRQALHRIVGGHPRPARRDNTPVRRPSTSVRRLSTKQATSATRRPSAEIFRHAAPRKAVKGGTMYVAVRIGRRRGGLAPSTTTPRLASVSRMQPHPGECLHASRPAMPPAIRFPRTAGGVLVTFAPVLALIASTVLFAGAAWSVDWYSGELHVAAEIAGGAAAIVAMLLLYRQIRQQQATPRTRWTPPR